MHSNPQHYDYFYFGKMFFPLFSASHQVGISQAGGLKEISKWLSEALRATPPVMNKYECIPEGCQKLMACASGIPSGCGFYLRLYPVVSLVRSTRLTTG
ncbi:MAG: hypothetical protein LBM04_13305 [Opitutaceae bacterium]|jgi:hypothetical protein|nr:hypothetical protein [Opitutaceae bacterium]